MVNGVKVKKPGVNLNAAAQRPSPKIFYLPFFVFCFFDSCGNRPRRVPRGMTRRSLKEREYKDEESRRAVARYCYSRAADLAYWLPAGVDPRFDDPCPRAIATDELASILDGSATFQATVYDTTDEGDPFGVEPLVLDPNDPGIPARGPGRPRTKPPRIKPSKPRPLNAWYERNKSRSEDWPDRLNRVLNRLTANQESI